MDKIILTAFLTALAGFITFVLSIVKLVNEKESKTTDYRQAWTTSVRGSLAALISKLSAFAHAISSYRNNLDGFKAANDLNPDGEEKAKTDRYLTLFQNSLESSLEAVRELRREVLSAYASARLHFKPGDLSFFRVESKFEAVMNLIEEMDDSEKSKEDRKVLRQKVMGEINELTNFCREILKVEWETVKRGEPTYVMTKRYSVYGGAFTLGALFLIGIYAAFVVVNIEIVGWNKDDRSCLASASQHVARSSVGSPVAPQSMDCQSFQININGGGLSTERRSAGGPSE